MRRLVANILGGIALSAVYCTVIFGALFLTSLADTKPISVAPITEYEHFERAADGKPICPKCGRSDHVLVYLYGLRREPPPEGMSLGGCTLGPKSPKYRCRNCNASFGIVGKD
jgi:hypothetical protein